MEIPVNEQWLLEGNCAQCRRSSYCSKDCGAVKRRRNALIRKAYEEILAKKLEEEAKEAENDN